VKLNVIETDLAASPITSQMNLAHLTATVREKLTIANPKLLEP